MRSGSELFLARRPSHRQAAFAQIEFATDSPLEEDGFELPVRSRGKPGYRPFCAAQAPSRSHSGPGRGDACDLLLLSCRPDAETACSRCARISRCPVGLHHAPSCFYLANSRLRATARVAAARASRSKLSASSKTALLAPGSVNCAATSRACSARSSHSKASFNGDGIRSSHSVYKTVSFRRGGRLAPSRQLFVHEKRLPEWWARNR